MLKIAILDDYQEVSQKIVEWSVLTERSDVVVEVFTKIIEESENLASILNDFQVISAMRERTPFPRTLLEQLPNLRLLVTTGMRNASIDLDAATEMGIMVCGTSGSSQSTSELTWGLILSLLRHIPTENTLMRRGYWQTTLGGGLEDKTLGVIGLGRLGSQVATVGYAFGMSVIAWSQNLTAEKAAQFNAKLVSKNTLLSEADIVTIHLQLSSRTQGLIGASELARMKSTSYLINTSRGPIVDEAALIEALKSKSIAGAGLDVFDSEPLPASHPLMNLDNTVLTPHLGYVTEEGYKVFYGETIENIVGYLDGNPMRVLNPAVISRI